MEHFKFYGSLLVSIFIFAFNSQVFAEDTLKVIERTFVSSIPEVQIMIQAPVSLDKDAEKNVNFSQVSLNNGSGEKVFCQRIVFGKNRVKFFFKIDQVNFVIFEKLVSDSSGYYLDNAENIQLKDTVIKIGDLRTITENKIVKIPEDSWKKFVFNDYSSQYLFPQAFDIGIDPNIVNTKSADSSQTLFYINFIQSGHWVKKFPVFWGVKARWSTGKQDQSNFAELYPLTILLNSRFIKTSFGLNVETSYLGFKKQGRAGLMADVRYRIPYNPINLTLGYSRVRIFPMLYLTAKGNYNWADAKSADTLKIGYDFNAGVRYGIPISKAYYIQLNGSTNYSSITKKPHYSYDISLGYIANGVVRIAAAYEQGFQEVSYKFDRKLLIDFAFDLINNQTHD